MTPGAGGSEPDGAMTGESCPSVLVCVAVEGHFLQGDTVRELREQAFNAMAAGAAGVFVSQGAIGDPVVVAAGLSTSVPDALLGVRIELARDGRHPAMLARDLTSLDLVSDGRSVLCFEPPFTEELAEAIALCRALWREGVVASEGPRFPAHAPVTRARPLHEAGPLVALDLTSGDSVPPSFRGLADLLLHPTPDPLVCKMERV
jgi:hypothetical protein